MPSNPSLQKQFNVLMVAATPFFSDRGCHIRIMHEVKHISALGVSVRLVTYGLGRDIPGICIERSMHSPWYTDSSPGPTWHKAYLDPLLVVTTLKAMFRHRPDIIHAHLYEGLLVAWIARSLCRLAFWRHDSVPPIIFDVQGGLAAEMYEYALKGGLFGRLWYGLFHLIERTLLVLPDAIICSSTRSKDMLTHSFGLSNEYVKVVPDGYSQISSPRSPDSRARARKHLGIPDGNDVIMYVGSMTSAKGVEELLKAVPQTLATRPTTTFVYAGSGGLVEKYRSLYKKYITLGQVIILGAVAYQDVPHILAAADIAIDPKTDSTESSGKLMDYVAARVPAYCLDPRMSDVPGVSYIENLSSLASVLDQTLKKKISHIEMGDSGSENGPHSWNTIARDLLATYRSASTRRISHRRIRSYAIGAAVAVIFLVLFFRYSSLSAVFHVASTADVGLVALSMFIYAVIYALRALRLARVSPVSGFIDNAILVSFHIFFGAILPARLGEASYPILLKKFHGVSFKKGISDLAYIRALDALNVILVAPVLMMYFKGVFGLSTTFVLLIIGEVAIVMIMRIAAALARFLPRKIGAHTITDMRVLWPTSIMSLVMSLFMMAFGVTLMSALHVAAPMSDLIAGSALALIAGAIPFQGFFGLGGIEAGWFVSLKASGMSSAASFTLGTSYHAINFAFTVLFAAVSLAVFLARKWLRTRHHK